MGYTGGMNSSPGHAESTAKYQRAHPEQNKAKCKKWREAHAEQAREIRRVSGKRLTQQRKEFVQSFLEGQTCALCGTPHDLLFHHVDPTTKLFNIGGGNCMRSEESYRAEIAKCVIWCRACHMRYHRTTKPA
jgi:hypothetical protein